MKFALLKRRAGGWLLLAPLSLRGKFYLVRWRLGPRSLAARVLLWIRTRKQRRLRP